LSGSHPKAPGFAGGYLPGLGDPIRIGRVLIDASKEDLARTEEIRLPRETRSFFVSEQEPEITYLTQISVVDEESGVERVLASKVVLHPGDGREFLIPEEFVGGVTLKLRGYYESLLDRFANCEPISGTGTVSDSSPLKGHSILS
jgi:hypothetical protein